MGILIHNGGFLSTIQDAGIIGHQQYGVSICGAIDKRSFNIANILVDNAENEAAIEITILGPSIEFNKSNVIAITGADLSPMINGEPIQMYRAILVNMGDVLSFGAPKTGCRSYISFSGGIGVKPFLGSSSTYIRAKLGGFNGRKLDKGDIISFKAPNTNVKNINKRQTDKEDFGDTKRIIRVVMGPQEDYFTESGIHTFLNTTYKVSNMFDRMGCRLEGEVIEHITDGNIVSDGIPLGAIQVPSNGVPIILLADRQSVGGYTKIAAICTVDLPFIAQAKAGDEFMFKSISVQEAIKLLRDEREALDALRVELDKDYFAAKPYNFKVSVDGRQFEVLVEELGQ